MPSDTVGGTIVDLQREVADLGVEVERLRGVLREVVRLARGSVGGSIVDRGAAMRGVSVVALRGLLGGSVSREKVVDGNK